MLSLVTSQPLSLFVTNLDPNAPGRFPPSMWLARADFDASNALQRVVNLTAPMEGVGYLSLSPNGSAMLIASQTKSMEEDVQTYVTSAYPSGGLSPPHLLFADDASQMALLSPCGARCTAVSTFHGIFAPDASLVFAFTLWQSDGEGFGSQALAVADAGGGGVRALTWTDAGSFNGLDIFDECPTPTTDASRILFTRSSDDGYSTALALVDTSSGNVSVLAQLPNLADSSGCPALLPGGDGFTVLFMGCSLPKCASTRRERRRRRGHAWRPRSAAAAAAARVNVENTEAYFTISIAPGIAPADIKATTLFQVPLTDTPDTEASYAITQCDAIHGSAGPDPLSCQGSDKTHSFFMRLLVEEGTGKTLVNSTNTFLYCITPRCSLTAVSPQ